LEVNDLPDGLSEFLDDLNLNGGGDEMEDDFKDYPSEQAAQCNFLSFVGRKLR
jgi:hypothetical protein